jgi:DNA-binding transcriptional MerR regulator
VRNVNFVVNAATPWANASLSLCEYSLVEYRIEQLAGAAGVAVDTIRFYQGKGLLFPPRREGRVTWYDSTHLERLRQIRALQERGFSLTVIRRFLDGELASSDIALVAAVTAPDRPQTLSLAELAAQSGIPIPLLKQLEQAGLLVPLQDNDGPRYPADDLSALAAGLELAEAGIPMNELLELGARHAASVEQTARSAVDLFDEHIRKRIRSQAADPAETERQLLDVFTRLLEASSKLVHHHFQRTLLRAAREHIERTG